ncbi:hypothetical protein [Psychrobacter sp. DAB_AL43B]|uniref:hypothetical protein n=1 Tax=Psychrobacter sp. DAB_AL43B TaxID=1028416 RepID=UPI0009A5E182|nr:hypothetical protein [Psychrobacter sp. DAB_AL43B]SLJ84458.1 hypothetical protein DABAL43B_1262 [Psychrobacter sp. DAB_AL43B]
MNDVITGSDLTRAMLQNGHKGIWCAVDDCSDEDAVLDLVNNDFTAYIISFYDGKFYCEAGMAWSCAVPIKISVMTQNDVGL